MTPHNAETAAGERPKVLGTLCARKGCWRVARVIRLDEFWCKKHDPTTRPTTPVSGVTP